MWKINLRAATALGRFRSALLLVLSVTIVIAAVIAIVGVLTQFGEQMWKVVGTFGVTALISFAMLLQTFSLSRGRAIDRINGMVGIPVSLLSYFAMVDGVWDWQILYRLFGSDWELYGKVIQPIAMLALVTAGYGLLLNVRHHALAVQTALATQGFAAVVWLWATLNTWFPKLFTETVVNEWGSYQEPTRFWQSFIIITGILLGAFAVLTFVLELMGIARSRAGQVTGLALQLPADAAALLHAAAQSVGKSDSDYAGQLLVDALHAR